MKKIKGFSYDTELDMDVIEHIRKQPHEASYIIGLIRKDMNKVDETKELVKQYVEELLKNKDITFENKKASDISKEDIIDLLNIGCGR